MSQLITKMIDYSDTSTNFKKDLIDSKISIIHMELIKINSKDIPTKEDLADSKIFLIFVLSKWCVRLTAQDDSLGIKCMVRILHTLQTYIAG